MSRKHFIRFRLWHLLLLFAVVAAACWILPEAAREIRWRPERARLQNWASQLDRDNEINHLMTVIDGEAVFAISTELALTDLVFSSKGVGTISRKFPSPGKYGVEERPTTRMDDAFFITPQCIWVESIDEAIDCWKRTKASDWERYRSLLSTIRNDRTSHPARRP